MNYLFYYLIMADNQEENGENTIEENEYDIKFKIMIVGDSTVGKTSILRRYCIDEFTNKYATTIGIDFQFKNFTKNDKKIRLQIWDTAGQERFKSVAKNYFNSSDGFIVIYDITNRESFNNIDNWVSQINDVANKSVKFVLFGNKSDLQDSRAVNYDEGAEIAKKNSMVFYETSAKNGENINEGFEFLVDEMLKDGNNQTIKNEVSSLKIEKKDPIKKKACC